MKLWLKRDKILTSFRIFFTLGLQRYQKQCDGNLRAVVQKVIQNGQELAICLATKVHYRKNNVT